MIDRDPRLRSAAGQRQQAVELGIHAGEPLLHGSQPLVDRIDPS